VADTGTIFDQIHSERRGASAGATGTIFDDIHAERGGAASPPAYDPTQRGSKMKGTPSLSPDSFLGTLVDDISAPLRPLWTGETPSTPHSVSDVLLNYLPGVQAYHLLKSIPGGVADIYNKGQWGKGAARVLEAALPFMGEAEAPIAAGERAVTRAGEATADFARGAAKHLKNAPLSPTGRVVGGLVGGAAGGELGSLGGTLRALEGASGGAALGAKIGSRLPAVPGAIKAGIQRARYGPPLADASFAAFDPANYVDVAQGMGPVRPPVQPASSTIPAQPVVTPPNPPTYGTGRPVVAPLRTSGGATVPVFPAEPPIPFTPARITVPPREPGFSPVRPPLTSSSGQPIFNPQATSAIPPQPVTTAPNPPTFGTGRPVVAPIRSGAGTVVPVPETTSTSAIPVTPVGPLPEVPGSGTPVRPPLRNELAGSLPAAVTREQIEAEIARATGKTTPPAAKPATPPAAAADEATVQPAKGTIADRVKDLPPRYRQMADDYGEVQARNAFNKDTKIAEHLMKQKITPEQWDAMSFAEQQDHAITGHGKKGSSGLMKRGEYSREQAMSVADVRQRLADLYKSAKGVD
jgi:hypothetical protein